MIAQQYYIDHGLEMNIEKLESSLSSYVPVEEWKNAVDSNNEQRWLQLVLHAYRKVKYTYIYNLTGDLILKDN